MCRKAYSFLIFVMMFCFLWSASEGAAFSLSVIRAGSGSGTVTSSPSGISCGSGPECTGNFSQGKKVTLKAKADSGSSFMGWAGSGCSGTGSCSVVMNSDVIVTARFEKKVPQLSVSPDSLNFGALEIGKKASLTFTVSNTGTGDLHVTFSGLEGTDFSVNGSSTQTIKPGKSKSSKLLFKPQTEGDHRATLKISSDDPQTPLKQIPVEGQSTSVSGTDYSKLAKSLAKKLSTSRTPQARYDALLSIMEALHVGIYTAEGKAVLVGYERGPDDFYLYDFELTGMAGSLERSEMFTLEDIADPINAIILKGGGDGIGIETLRQDLLSGVQAAVTNPKEIESLVRLLVCEIGLLNDPDYDMRKDVPQEQLKFNALQRFLIFADIFIPLIQESPPVRMSSLLENSEGTIEAEGIGLKGLPCDSIKGWKGWWPFASWGGKFALGVLPGKAGAIIILSMDTIHGTIIANCVKFYDPNKDKDPHYRTHYGPPGHYEDAGKELRAQVQVWMDCSLPNILVGCGWLVGEQFPGFGPIGDVEINWDTSGIEKYGTVSYDPWNLKTGQDGISTLIFKPKDEKSPGKGKIQFEYPTVIAQALYQSSFKNIPGSVSQFFDYRFETFLFVISYHGCPKSGSLAFSETRISTVPDITLSHNGSGTFNFKMDEEFVIKPSEVTSQVTDTTCSASACATCQGGNRWVLTGKVNGATKDNCGDTLEVNLQVTGSTGVTCTDSEGNQHVIPPFSIPGFPTLTVEMPYKNGASVPLKEYWPPGESKLSGGNLTLSLEGD